MGVVHKLRDDVVEFILAQKKARPEISVRKLSDVVLKEFQIVVSKSSVSTVLKNASLNSPIGRHGASGEEIPDGNKKAAGTFKIPEHKKKQIFPAPKNTITNHPDKPVLSPPKIVKIENKIDIKKEAKEIKLENIEKPAPIKVEEKKSAPPVSNLKTENKLSPETVKGSFENAGMIFLKAAERDLSGASVLAKIFKEELGGRYDIDYDFLADLLLFPEMFNQKSSVGDNSRRIEGLFSLNNKNIPFDPQAFSAAMAAVNHIENCGLKLAIELEILMRGVSSIRLTDQTGKFVFYNAKNKTISLENVHSEETSCVDEAIEVFNSEIVRNVHSAVFHSFSNTNSLEQLVSCLISGVGSKSGEGLREAVFYDVHGAELVKNTYFPPKTAPLF